jgi:hypothetical protein
MRPQRERLRRAEGTLAHGAGAGGGEPAPQIAGRVGELRDQLRLAQRRELAAQELPAPRPVVPPLPIPPAVWVSDRREGLEPHRVQRPVRTR